MRHAPFGPRGCGSMMSLFVFFLCFSAKNSAGEDNNGGTTSYLLYSANPGEGFNLRRDVYMRAATLIKDLHSKGEGHWVLVLLPWPRLYHWRSDGVKQVDVKWEAFFDLSKLKEYVPVIEFDEYIKREGRSVEEVAITYLPNFDAHCMVGIIAGTY